MIADISSVPHQTTLACDIAIVGSGAAGITVACELIDSGLKVLVLEGGGKRCERATQRLYEGTVDDPSSHGSLLHYRRRMFGGTTSVWGGRCAPFDPIDFESRPYVRGSGWPINRADLNPYYERAHVYTDIGAFDYSAATALSDPDASAIPQWDSSVVAQDQLWRFSLPTNFAAANQAHLAASEQVRVLLHANVLKVEVDPNGQRATALTVASLDGRRITVQAGQYVLAAGGLETTRLLLESDDVTREGLGNGHDQVGRCYGSHLSGDLCAVHFTSPPPKGAWGYVKTIDGVYAKRNWRIHETVQRETNLLNSRFLISHPPFEQYEHRSGVLSAAYLVKWLYAKRISPEFSGAMASGEYAHVMRHIRNVAFDLHRIAAFGVHWMRRRTFATRKYPSVSLPSADQTYTIHYDAEQTPNPDSRVSLSPERDALGVRRLHIAWKCGEQDVDNVVRSYQVLKDEIERAGVGTCKAYADDMFESVKKQVSVGSHHIGTTRMSGDPAKGVVDAQCKMHDVANVYIAGPSVFATTGFANPVLTAVALAVRLADHLKEQYKK